MFHPELLKINRCYDSHTHYWATGQVAQGLKLQSLTNASDILHLKMKDHYFRADWLIGFGWDQNKWPQNQMPHKKILDQAFPNQPVFFSRVDGHASWINSVAIQQLKKKGYDFTNDPIGGKIIRESNLEPTGLLFDQAHIQALQMLPDFTTQQHDCFLSESQKIFNQAGFTHVRDLSMNSFFWNLLVQKYEKKSLTVCIDAFATAENLNDFDRVLNDIQLMQKNPCPNLRIHGVKIFVDGSLGSQTAYLSKNYLKTQSAGILIWKRDEIKELIRLTWSQQLDVAIHAIGDQAAHEVVLAAREVSALGVLGRLHLEHVQILRPETIQLMKPLHIRCHMQPCHWLTDQAWLHQVLPSELQKNLFQWELLRKNKIPFDFGSDSPIEVSSLFRNQAALKQSSEFGVPLLNDDWLKYHSHPDTSWTKSWTEFSSNEIKQVYFNEETLL